MHGRDVYEEQAKQQYDEEANELEQNRPTRTQLTKLCPFSWTPFSSLADWYCCRLPTTAAHNILRHAMPCYAMAWHAMA